MLTDIRDLVKQVGHTHSATDAPCRLQQMAELDEVKDLEAELTNSDEKRQLLVNVNMRLILESWATFASDSKHVSSENGS